METYINKVLGFKFEYPKGWNQEFTGIEIILFPPDYKKVFIGKNLIPSPALSVMVGEEPIQNPLKYYKEFISNLSKVFQGYKLIWENPFRLLSGEEALEYSFEFVKGPQKFQAISITIVKGNMIITLSGSFLNSEVERWKPIIINIIRSLSLKTGSSLTS